jgi:hypothetical protein
VPLLQSRTVSLLNDCALASVDCMFSVSVNCSTDTVISAVEVVGTELSHVQLVEVCNENALLQLVDVSV